MAISLRYSAL